MPTASCRMPPPFPRRSSTSCFIPHSFFRRSTCLRISWATPSVNPLCRMYPVVASSIPAYSMSGRWMRSRTTGMSSVSPLRSFLTVKTTVEPGSPFIRELASEAVRPATLTPSMAVISSPHCRL